MSNFKVLRETVLGCVSRAKSSFQAGGQNFADLAVNNAVIYAQRNWDFQWLKGDVSIDCNPKGSVLTAKDDCGCPVKLKRIIKAFGVTAPTGHGDLEIPFVSRQTQIERNTQGAKHCCNSLDSAHVIQSGQSVYLSPEKLEAHTLYFYALKWLPRLEKDTDTNFLFDYGFDFLMYRSIYELNFFIKEDERFQVSTKMLNDSWASLTAWDTYLVSPNESETEL
jgi:hypothetical protein